MSEPNQHHRRLTAVLVIAVVAMTITVLRAGGQPWWCECGVGSLWAGSVKSSHNSQHFVDPYSLSHVLHGVLFAGLITWGLGWLKDWQALVVAITAECLWEILENSEFVIQRYRTATIALGYEGDSIGNSLGDILSCSLGFFIARRIGVAKSVIFAVGSELLLLLLIRDNLTLNVLMLVYPVDAVRTWQNQ